MNKAPEPGRYRPAQPTFHRSHTTYIDDEYVDQNGNRWMIRISGEAEVVRAMIERGHIALLAEQIDETAWQQIAEEMHGKDRETAARRRARPPELPSLETHALLVRSDEHRYWSVRYEVVVPHAGNSWHTHSVYIGDDSLAKVDFTADVSPIDVYMGADVASGLSGQVRWETTNATISLLVHEDGTGYHFNGDAVVPPGR